MVEERTEPQEPDITSRLHGGADTSKEAHATTPNEFRFSQRENIFAFIVASGSNGATCDEVEEATDIPHQTASARIKELCNDEKIHYTDVRRKTRLGKTARVYFAGPRPIQPKSILQSDLFMKEQGR